MGGTYSSEEGQGPAEVQKDAQVAAKPSALVVCGPSGVGKGTLIKKLKDNSPRLFGFSCSHTTRSPRQGEQVGINPGSLEAVAERFRKAYGAWSSGGIA